jgi:hypothetical protein
VPGHRRGGPPFMLTLDFLLRDPVTRLLMDRDGVSARAFTEAWATARRGAYVSRMGEQAAAAARASTTMRRAATPAPATSPATGARRGWDSTP